MALNSDTNKKKVLVFEAYPVFSGSQRVSLNFCKVLHSNGYHVTLLLADDSKGLLRQNFEPFVHDIVLIKTHSKLTRYGSSDRWFKASTFLGTFFTALLPFYVSCMKIFAKGKFDYFYYCDLRGSVMMLVPTMFFKGKTICYLQGKNTLGPKFARNIYLRFVDNLLCPSTDVLESLPPSPKKSVLNYGIDFSQYIDINPTHVKAEIEKLLPVDMHNRTKLLCAGLVRPEKGAHHLIYAFKDIKATLPESEIPVLFLLGEPRSDAEKAFKAKLVEFSVANGLERYIYWLGWKNNVLEWMKNVDYFIFPTIDKEENNFEGFDKVIQSSEGSPVVLIESSLSGLFSLSSKVTGVNETITDNHNGIMYDPNIKGELSKKLIGVLKEKPKFVDFPSRERFSLATFSNKILNLFS